MNTQKVVGLAVTFCMLALTACSTQVTPESDAVESTSAALTKDFTFTTFVDPKGIGNAGAVATRLFIASKTQYQLVFGHAAPSSVNFAAGDRIAFYSAGVRPTGGYDASFSLVRRVNSELRIRTHLDAPGAGCFVTQALTKPYAMIKFRIAFKPAKVSFFHTTEIQDCEEPPTCDDVTCGADQHCEMLQIECITTPCNPIPTCMNNPPVDPCEVADCPGSCIGISGTAICVPLPDPCATVKCTADTECRAVGGIAGCVPKPAPFCGGIAGIACPGLGTCTDNPFDSCDPATGGADCGGQCACLTTKICVLGSVWNPSPNVCACQLP